MSREDLDTLLGAAIEAAQEFLGKNGEFYPFGMSLGRGGKIAMHAAHTGQEMPESTELIAVLEKGFCQNAQEHKIRAAAICFDVRVVPPGQSEKTDAIEVRLEHRDGQAIDAYLPYKKGFLNRIKYGELFACEGTPALFSANPLSNEG
jgi:hypothetical protein